MRRLSLVLALAVAACGGAVSPGAGAPITAVSERDGVRLTLTLPARTFGPGAVIWADVLVENTTDRAVSWVGGGCNFPAHVSASIPPKDVGRSWGGALGAWKERLLQYFVAQAFFVPEVAWADYQGGGSGPICTADIRINQLAAHESLTLRAAWDGMLQDQSPRVRAPAGTSEVTARFPVGDVNGSNPILAKLEIELTGGPRLASGGSAIDAALDDGRFRPWLEQRLAAERTDAPLASSIRLEQGNWRLQVAHTIGPESPVGPAGHSADVVVDGRTGAVRSVDLIQRP